ncbi:AAA family ATPase [Sphingomonas oligophenolica]|uniref:N-acetylglucosamine-6-phosphate isomerase n=1 Tax=Sphingomonas oligophenolica TaxID=301154 RepID=A0A502CGS0_9SPHN|nr:AAA family ATPase [Sphingomonas oligophenolica]TPG12357.1 N-acetylglucosamine-6-phosphate isomerase [Sphingomonas oligophenolica]
MTLRSICLHGPESTGKSTIGARLAAQLGTPLVDEYGRDYAEMHGTEFAMADLVSIAKGHDEMTRAALAQGRYPAILDTDPLMTAVWADMLFGRRDPWFDAWDGCADLYLLFDIDLPWVGDGTRMFGTDAARRRFFDLSKAELDRRGVAWRLVSGVGEARWASVLRAIGVAADDQR